MDTKVTGRVFGNNVWIIGNPQGKKIYFSNMGRWDVGGDKESNKG